MKDIDVFYAPADEKPLDNMVADGGFCGIFRTIACIGDSLSSGEFESRKADGTKGYHDCFDYSWGQYMARMAGCKVYNFSRGGMTAEEYVENFADNNNLWSTDKLAQAYIIALGVNDIFGRHSELGSVSDIDTENYENNAKTFAGYYGKIISKYKKIQQNSLLSPLPDAMIPSATSTEIKSALCSTKSRGFLTMCMLSIFANSAPCMMRTLKKNITSVGI